MVPPLIPMPTAWKPTHMFVLTCGHVAWVLWINPPPLILDGEVTCHFCDGQTVNLEKMWLVP